MFLGTGVVVSTLRELPSSGFGWLWWFLSLLYGVIYLTIGFMLFHSSRDDDSQVGRGSS